MTTVHTRGTSAAQVEQATPPATEVTQPRGAEEPEEIEIEIERLILHALDVRRGQPRLVDEIVPLEQPAAAFFAGHLAAAARRADWSARFVEGAGEVPALCDQLLRSPEAFVAASQVLATRLYAQMAARPQAISPGDFVVVVYRVRAFSGDSVRMLALLKLDPDARLLREFSRVDGRLRVRILPAANLLPDPARLQKCALILPTPSGAAHSAPPDGAASSASSASYAVRLLDTQAGPRSQGVAAFFYRGFLGTELAPSPRRWTRLFLRVSEDWLAGHAAQLAPETLFGLYRARRQALAAGQIDLAAFAVEVFPQHSDLRASLLAALLDGLADPVAGRVASFPVDRATAAPAIRYVTLLLDGGARLRVLSESFERLVQVAPHRVGNALRLTLDSLTVREVFDT